MFHSSSLLIDVYASSFFLTLVSDGYLMTQAEKFLDPFLLKSDVNRSIIWLGKRMLRVVVLRVLFFVILLRLLLFSVADFGIV